MSTGHLLLFEAARFGQEEGYEQLHLGSGVGGTGDSLFEFKRRFISSPAIEPAFGKGVHDVQRYRDLTGSTEVDSEGFFPAYRCELSETAPPQRVALCGKHSLTMRCVKRSAYTSTPVRSSRYASTTASEGSNSDDAVAEDE